jgi:threonine/homoserine/homoserine lactone efflux protein
MKRGLPSRGGLPLIFGVALATGFSGAVVPGSLLAVVVTESVKTGWAAGPYMMMGHGALELIAMALLVTGLIRFARSSKVQGTIGLLGAAVLVYLGYQTLLIPGAAAREALRAAAGAGGGSGWLRLAWLGALMSAANPYWWLWWATIGVAHTGWSLQRGRLGGATYWVGHVLSDVIWYCAVAAAVGAGRALLSAGALRAIYVACGAFLLGLGAVFGVTGAKALRRAPDLTTVGGEPLAQASVPGSQEQGSGRRS